jgi:hypothetical protein
MSDEKGVAGPPEWCGGRSWALRDAALSIEMLDIATYMHYCLTSTLLLETGMKTRNTLLQRSSLESRPLAQLMSFA